MIGIENELVVQTNQLSEFFVNRVENGGTVQIDQSLEVERPRSLKFLIKNSFKNLPLVVEMKGNFCNLKENRQAKHFIAWLGKNRFYSHLRLLLTDCGDIYDINKNGGLQEALNRLPRAETGRAIVLVRSSSQETEEAQEAFDMEKPNVIFKTGESITISGQVFPLTKRLWYG